MGAKRLDRRVSDRYKLPADANREGRVGRGAPLAHIHKAEIFDVSYAGIAFRIASDIAPTIGEVVAVEFTLPNLPKMAWYAQVMRIEIDPTMSLPDNLVVLKVGAKFMDLPHRRRKELEHQIESLLSEVHKHSESRVHVLTEAIRVQRSFESSFLKLVRGFIVFAAALLLAAWFVQSLAEMGSSQLRTDRPEIWPGYKEHTPISPLREPAKTDGSD